MYMEWADAETRAADIFALMVLYCDDYITIHNDSDVTIPIHKTIIYPTPCIIDMQIRGRPTTPLTSLFDWDISPLPGN